MLRSIQTKNMQSPTDPRRCSRRTFGFAASVTALHSIIPGWVKNLQALTQESVAGLLKVSHVVTVTSDKIAYLMADRALRSASFKDRTDETIGTVKRFWVQNWRLPEEGFEWKINVHRKGSYVTTLMISAPAGTQVQVEGPKDKVVCKMTAPSRGGFSWDRITLPSPLLLPAGSSTVRIRLLDPVTTGREGAALKSIELLSSEEQPLMEARIRAFKSDTGWLDLAKFGFMTQCGEWSYPPHGPRKPWPEMVNQFDVENFADMIDSTGAGYAVWSATWATYFFPAPIKAIDAIMPGRTSERDLVGEIADALKKRNIRLILYYHLGHDTNAANGDWWSKNWVSPDDKTLFANNWCSIISEVGERYGERLAGWMFDDELVYYAVDYERFGKVAKAGNRSRLISYNPWIQARGTDFQDFQFGEGFTGIRMGPGLSHGIWTQGPMQGLHAHGNFQIDGPDWGISKPDTKIELPHFTMEKAIDIALEGAANNIALSWNMLMYDNGTVSDASLKLLQQVGQAVRKQYPRP